MAQSKKKHALTLARWLLLLPIPAIWCALDHYRVLDFLEDTTISWRNRYRGEIPAPVKVVYVDVDSESIGVHGSLPWDRKHFATVAKALVGAGKVKAVGFDFVFSEEGIPDIADKTAFVNGTREMAKFLTQQQPKPPVVMAASYSAGKYLSAERTIIERRLYRVANDPRPIDDVDPPEITSFAVGAAKIAPSIAYLGLIDTLEGGTRTIPAMAPCSTGEFFHMSLQLARLYWGLPEDSIKIAGDHIDFVKADGSVQATVPLRDRQFVDINWFSAWLSPLNPRISIARVEGYAENLVSENAKERADAVEFFEAFKDSVVLIGPVDPLIQDVAPTPTDKGPVPRVGVHGNMLKTIVSGLYLRQLPEFLEYGMIFGLTIVVSAFAAAGGKHGWRTKVTPVILVAVFVWLAFQLFASQQLVLPLAAPLGSIVTTTLVAVIWQLVEEERQKGRIKGMFGAYVSPQLVARMVESGEDPQLGGHESEITAYFSDIQSFSSFSEKLTPGRLVELMNEYLTACTDIVQREGGTLDKYIGDAVVVMFGAPLPLEDHAFRACVASQLVHQKLGRLRAQWKAEGEKWPDIVGKMQSRIGLNTGSAIIGNMGSRTRFNYTMMGDNVNLAARMESGAKSWGAYTMVTEVTRAACAARDKGRVIFRPLGRIVVMGRSQAVPIHEIVGLKENVQDSALECISIFERGLAHYYAREWDAAIQQFKRSAELEPNQPVKTPGVKLNPSLVYLNITEDYKAEEPPKDWDGVYVMKEK